MKEKILIALSDLKLTDTLSHLFREKGYAVSTARTGDDALEKMKTNKPDLVLIDHTLKGKNCYDVLEEKSLDRDITKIPVIVVSNSGAPLEMRRIPSTSSIKDYIVKAHVDSAEVFEKAEMVFGRVEVAPVTKDVRPSAPTVGKKILWVEDDKFLSMILIKKFETSGHTVLKATNAEEAFVLLEKEIPDIIILDVLLPGQNGFDILQKIKMNDRLKKIPVMILSNMSKSSDTEKAKMLGANKFLVKAAVSLDEIVKEVLVLTR